MRAPKTLDEARALQAFQRRRFPLNLKLQAVRIWLAGASLRKTAWALKDAAVFSHEAVRQWAHRITGLFRPKMLRRRIIVVDETSIYLANGKKAFGWAAIGGDTKEVLLPWISQGRSNLEAMLFIRNVRRGCRNRPKFLVDRGVWDPWAVKTLKLQWKVEKGAARSHVEGFFRSAKCRTRPMARKPGTMHPMRSGDPFIKLLVRVWNERVAIPQLDRSVPPGGDSAWAG